MEINKILYHIKAVLNSYSEVIFLQSATGGFFLFLLTFLNPNVGFAGLIAVVSAYLFARFLNMGKEFLSSGFYTYNPLLVGLSIGYLFKITPLTIFFTMVSGVFTLVFSIMLNSIFYTYLRVPILSFPFVFISSTIYLAVSSYSNLFVNSFYPHNFFSFLEENVPVYIASFFKSLGTIIFTPSVIAGIVVSVILLFYSRILFFLAVIGYYTGALITGFLTGSFNQSFSDINFFNFILISMALGGIFLIPSVKSYIISITAVAISITMLSAAEVFWSFYGVPAFTFPFNFITISFIYVLGLLSFPMVARYIRKTPEETLDFYLTSLNRFRGTERGIYLPFSGKWTVWQGFDGKWTHKGAWRYAYDFVITDENGKRFKGDGLRLEDYYAYRKPVLSPVRGRIVKVINDLPDNQIGQVDKVNNWGNLVIIQDERGFYVEISHLSQYSIKVKEGDWVEIGTFLGLCGNSGYSPEPHIHIQVQLTPDIGGYTVPFSFVSYISKNHFFSNDNPVEGEILESVYPDKGLDMKMNFILDEEYIYEVFIHNKKVEEIKLTVKMGIDGTFYFDTGKGKLFFGKQNGTFYFYRYEGNDRFLKLFFVSLPKLPLIKKKNLFWEDFIPISRALKNPLKRSLVLFLASFNHKLAQVSYEGQFLEDNLIEGKIVSKTLNLKEKAFIFLSEEKGIKSIQFGEILIHLKNTKREDNLWKNLPLQLYVLFHF